MAPTAPSSSARDRVDRAAHRRAVPGLLDLLRADPATRVVLVREDRVATVPDGARMRLATPTVGDLGARCEGGPDTLAVLGRWYFLGEDADGSLIALDLPAERPGADLEGFSAVDDAAPLLSDAELVRLRDAGHLLDAHDSDLAHEAVALAAWHPTAVRCPRCGEPTVLAQAGWVRRCVVDELDLYPRTDPAVIMAVLDDSDRLLLAHAAHWPAARMSTLAGFVEPGESLEQAVRREVAEEVQVEIGAVEYLGSQPWPFPASLMLAFRAQALTTELRPDGVEVTEARWFSREDLRVAVARDEVRLPMALSVARRMIDAWLEGAGPGWR